METPFNLPILFSYLRLTLRGSIEYNQITSFTARDRHSTLRVHATLHTHTHSISIKEQIWLSIIIWDVCTHCAERPYYTHCAMYMDQLTEAKRENNKQIPSS